MSEIDTNSATHKNAADAAIAVNSSAGQPNHVVMMQQLAQHPEPPRRAQLTRMLNGRCDPGFVDTLSRFPIAELEVWPHAVFALDHEFRIAYTNPAWDLFAHQNGGQPTIRHNWGLGACFFHALPASLGDCFTELFATSARAGTRGSFHPVSYGYECSSPTVYRRYQMSVHPIPPDRGFLVTNTLIDCRSYQEVCQPTPPAAH